MGYKKIRRVGYIYICVSLFLSAFTFAADKHVVATDVFKIEPDFAQDFAEDWIDSWNNHDMERILAHYTDDFIMTSPNIVRLNLAENGTLQGKSAMRNYWGPAVGPNSRLKMTLLDVLVAIDSLTIYYSLQNGRVAAEVFHFNIDGFVHRAFAHYSL